ncbi:HAD family hydrolase [Streptomyces sp. WAC06614]|uniref:HAD family hydrolase n=1 Tax=Streptomyces sp. WAC06614 TaxID=2487416 RepID=UPI000F768A44|nr:HAD family hydrolase [Streptomyces sp. WAC06614]RSS70323.1 HAD family hydrolase [Streptomyces sp. WAC06614]
MATAAHDAAHDGRPRAALFDLDGTLVDTNYLHALTWWQALHQYEQEVPMARIHRAVGMGGDKLLDHLLGEARDRRHDDDLRAAHRALYATWFDSLPVLDGAADLLRATAARGLRIVLASSASAEEVAAVRSALDVDEIIHDATSADQVDATKPAPDLVEQALERAGAEPGEAVFIGDTVWDVKAAARAGVTCIGLLTGGIAREELTAAGPVAVYDSPTDLLRHLDTSPLGRRRT